MSVITFPDTLRFARMSWGQKLADVDFDSPFGSQSQEIDVPRWLVTADANTMYERDAGAWQALILSLKGKKNQLELWNHGRPVPRGTLRGSLTLKNSVVQGATSMTLLSASGNTLQNANNLAVSPWTQNISGFWTSAASTDILGPDGINANVTKFTVGAASSSVLFTRQGGLAIPSGARTASLYIYVPSGQGLTSWRCGADWQDAETNVGTTSTVFDAWVRISVSATLAATRNALDFNMLLNNATPVAGSGKFFYAAFAKEEAGSSATAYGYGQTLLAGDFLGLGSGTTQQVVMVTDDATAVGQGEITVNIQPPLRNAFSAGSTVTWNKPKALFRRADSETMWEYSTITASGFSLNLIEDWR